MKSLPHRLVVLAVLCSALALLVACGTSPGGDTTPPSLMSATPIAGAVEVPLNASIVFAFNEPIGELTLTPSPLVGMSSTLWDESGQVATIRPDPSWPAGASLSFQVTAEDEAGNELTFSHAFTTLDDDTPPAAPTGLAASGLEESVTVSWAANTEPDLSGYLLFWGEDAATPTGIVALPATATEYLVSGLENGVTYQLYLVAEDGAGNRSGPSSTVTATPGDVTPPTLTSSTPADGLMGVGLVETVRFSFSEPLAPATFYVTLHEVQAPAEGQPLDPNAPVVQELDASKLGAAIWNGANTVVQFDGVAPDLFESDRAYRFRLLGTDVAGNDIPATTTVSFATGEVQDVIPPTPGYIVTDIDQNLGRAVLTFHFNEAMDKAATQAAFNSAPTLACVWTWPTASAATCTVSVGLLQHQIYALQFTTAAKDLAGNGLSAVWNSSFTVGNLSPRLVSYTPAPLFGMPRIVNDQYQPIVWTFTEAVQVGGIIGEVRNNLGVLVDSITPQDNLILSPDSTKLTYYPPAAYPCLGSVYTWTLTRVYESGGVRHTPTTYSGSFQCGQAGVGVLSPSGSLGE